MGNRICWRLAVLLLAWLAPHNYLFAAECEHWAGKLVSAQGKIEVRRSESNSWQAVKRQDIFCPGDHIRSADNSRAAIILSNQTLLRLNQNSAIKLSQFDNGSPSILEFFQGIGHFISRVPRSLKVETATVDASIKGTEFVVEADADETTVTVFEGTVLTQNTLGEQSISNGESVIATAYDAPLKTLLAKPRDRVQWALYFPPLIEDGTSEALSKASRLLNVGRVKQAQALLVEQKGGDALALKSIIAGVNNNKDKAFQLANESVKQSASSAAAHIALSYAWQSKLDLNQALASAQKATESETDNAIAWARLAELQLSIGELDKALDSANQAIKYNAQLSRTQSILAYAYLLRINTDKAINTFNKAIELDQVDPLPRLGLGLAKIRNNNLAEGRRQIEIATSLDPNNAIIRSYLGKAYFEENRPPLDGEQFLMAKELDPNDPTAFFYDAIRKQSENNPVGALDDLNKSIELNDNRAVYRSSLQLDQDSAARSVSLANVYQDLGFQQLALLEGWKSLNTDPGNSSAHQFLADSYQHFTDRSIARVSELMQAQLLQPINLKPMQTQLAQSDSTILHNAGPVDPAFTEYTPLFVSDGAVLQLNGIIGNNNIRGDDLSITGITGKLMYSLAQFHYETDGFRENNDLTHDAGRAFLQYDISHRASFQLEYNSSESEEGDRRLNVLGFSDSQRLDTETDTLRAGFHYKHSPSSQLLISAISQEQFENKEFAPGFAISFDGDSSIIEAQYIYNGSEFSLIAGTGHLQEDNAITAPFIGTTTTGGTHDNAYLYTHFNCTAEMTCTLGASADRYDSENNNIDTNQINPKLGIFWNITDSTTLRAAIFRNLKRLVPADQTLEPTQVAGFNQFYDDQNATDSKVAGLGMDQQAGDQFFWGLQAFRRELDIPDLTAPTVFDEWQESNYQVYAYHLLSSNTSLGLEYLFEDYERERIAANIVNKVRTHELPIFLRYHSATGFLGKLQARYIDQTSISLGANQEFEDEFVLVDISLGYRLPRSQMTISFDVQNLFDTEFIYQDDSFRHLNNKNVPEFLPDRTAYMRFSLLF